MRKRRRWALFAAGVVSLLLAANVALLVIEPSLALPRSLAAYFFGPKMIRAEVVLADADGLHDYRLDQGRAQGVAPARETLRLIERDGRVVTVRVAPDARIEVNGQPAPLGAIRRGMNVLVVRDGEQPAEIVLATGRR